MTRNASWLQTFTGKKLTPLDPHLDQICIEDIAHGLSQVCRFSGQVRDFYSVADHSIHVTDLVEDPNLKLVGLLHDASESYIVDIPAPIKSDIQGYAEIEEKIMRVIAEKFGIDYELFSHPLVKQADMIALSTEKRDLMGPEPAPWIDMPKPSARPLAIRTPKAAERVFLMRFDELGGRR